ncbi:hypothetical protein [[Flexibacter] sp. ATCC 35208]|uniref:hypothetical protein n=1 Tax=[Flexibacter] sp. ATCC 35208 TaxID=1936242 RepID=UPI0015C30E11|nr:hypothetical protein [[Flexibacter] sp. ATCC 35208]
MYGKQELIISAGGSATENALFSNIANIRMALPAGYPTVETTNPNAYVVRLNEYQYPI